MRSFPGHGYSMLPCLRELLLGYSETAGAYIREAVEFPCGTRHFHIAPGEGEGGYLTKGRMRELMREGG